MLVKSPPRQPRPTASRWALIAEGLNYVWTTKVVLGAISLDLFAVLLGGVTALLPVYARDILHVGPEGFGVLPRRPRRPEPSLSASHWPPGRPKSQVGLKMFAAVAIYGLSTLVFAFSRSMALSVAGACRARGGRHGLGLRAPEPGADRHPRRYARPRLGDISLFIGASNELGEFKSGGMARLLGPVGSAIFGGCGAIVVTLLWAWIFPALREADRLE